MLRALQAGIRITELDELDEGMVMDIITEAANDRCEYREVASQSDFDRF